MRCFLSLRWHPRPRWRHCCSSASASTRKLGKIFPAPSFPSSCTCLLRCGPTSRAACCFSRPAGMTQQGFPCTVGVAARRVYGARARAHPSSFPEDGVPPLPPIPCAPISRILRLEMDATNKSASTIQHEHRQNTHQQSHHRKHQKPRAVPRATEEDLSRAHQEPARTSSLTAATLGDSTDSSWNKTAALQSLLPNWRAFFEP